MVLLVQVGVDAATTSATTAAVVSAGRCLTGISLTPLLIVSDKRGSSSETYPSRPFKTPGMRRARRQLLPRQCDCGRPGRLTEIRQRRQLFRSGDAWPNTACEDSNDGKYADRLGALRCVECAESRERATSRLAGGRDRRPRERRGRRAIDGAANLLGGHPRLPGSRDSR